MTARMIGALALVLIMAGCGGSAGGGGSDSDEVAALQEQLEAAEQTIAEQAEEIEALNELLSAQEPTEAPEATEEPTGEPTPADSAAQGQDAAVGDSITLESSEGAKVRAAVVEIMDPAPAGEFDSPEGRYVAFRLEFENVGEAVYEDSPGNMLVVVDGENQQHMTTFADIEGCQGFDGGMRIAPGDTRLGCEVVDLPEGATIQHVEITLDSGFGPQTGRWSL